MAISKGAFRALALGAIALSLSALHVAVASAQATPVPSREASLTINVCDPTGAVVPNAEITLAGANSFTAKTRPDGSSQIHLPYGTYIVTVRSPGFKVSVVRGVVIDTADPPGLRVVLEMGSTDGNYFLLEGVRTITSDVPNLIQPRGLEYLPLGGGPVKLLRLVYSKSFSACSAQKPCTKREKFKSDSASRCCFLTVQNGDRGEADDVISYKVFLNGTCVIPSETGGLVQVPVILRKQNKLKIVLLGEPSSKVVISIVRDP